MKTLLEIIEDCKDNKRPEQQELIYAVLALSALNTLSQMTLREINENTKPFMLKMKQDNIWQANRTALNKDPKSWLGKEIPENPEYQKFREMGNKILDKFFKEDKQ